MYKGSSIRSTDDSKNKNYSGQQKKKQKNSGGQKTVELILEVQKEKKTVYYILDLASMSFKN